MIGFQFIDTSSFEGGYEGNDEISALDTSGLGGGYMPNDDIINIQNALKLIQRRS